MYLYKYRDMNERNLLSLKKRQVWYSVGRKFNDPFDCTLNVPINLMTGSSMLAFIHKYTSAKKLLDANILTSEQVEQTAIKYLEQTQELMIAGRIGEHPLYSILEIVLASLERSFVCCFSKNATNHLLWSHYADSHKGYCIRYKKDILFRDIAPKLYGDVVYDDTSIDLVSVFDNYSNVARDIIFRKSLCWSYEDEVRLIHNDISNYEDELSKMEVHSDEAIDCIILGYNFNMKRLDELKLLVSNDSIMFKKIERSTKSYKLYVSPELL